MTDKLPANLLPLFQPRPPLRYLQPCDYPPEQRKSTPISGVAQFLDELQKPDPDYVPTESWLQARDRKKREKKEKQERMMKEGNESCMSRRASCIPLTFTTTNLFLYYRQSGK